MVKVAEKLGVHSSSLYRHFESREELFFELASDHVRKVRLDPFVSDRWQEWVRDASLQIYDMLVEFPYLIYVDAFDVSRVAMKTITEPVLANLHSLGYRPDRAQSLWMGLLMLCGGVALANARLRSNHERIQSNYRSLIADPKFREDTPHTAEAITDPASVDLRAELKRSTLWCIRGFVQAHEQGVNR